MEFPLFENGITKSHVNDFWKQKGWVFPEVSNCRFCFHHTYAELRYQAEVEPENLQWWLDMEKKVGRTFARKSLDSKLKNRGKEDSTSSGCLCTD